MKIKICGLSREQDIDYLNEARPSYCGFVFAESRRQVSPAQAVNLRRRLAEGITPVGVFVNAPLENIIALYRDGIIDIAQLHGNETEEYIAQLKETSGDTPIPVIQVIKLGSREWGVGSGERCLDNETASVINSDSSNNTPPLLPTLHSPLPMIDYYLLDSGAGAGKAFDWGLLKLHSPLPTPYSPFEKPWFLAGGINLDNIEQAMALNPFGIDVSSGAETDGVKDREKILQLVATVRKGNTV